MGYTRTQFLAGREAHPTVRRVAGVFNSLFLGIAMAHRRPETGDQSSRVHDHMVNRGSFPSIPTNNNRYGPQNNEEVQEETLVLEIE
jgi:hypothetical protein